MKNVMRALSDARPVRLDPPGTPPLPFALTETATETAAAPARRRSRAVALLPAGALAAVAAVVAGAVIVNGSPTVPAPGGPQTSTEAAQPPTASQMLLAAAEHSSREAPATGRYLVVRSEHGSVLTVRSGDSAFRMTDRTSYEIWLSRTGEETTRSLSRDLGLTPLTDADADAWRAAGSPAEVLVGKPLPNGDVGPGSPVRVAGDERPEVSTDDGAIYALGVTSTSVRDLEKLPTDPEALRGALLDHYDGGGGDLPTDRDQWLLSVASALITEIPVSGPVRTAAFRLLATMDGVRSLGTVADQRGREGHGFAFTDVSKAGGAIERRFVIDPATGRALGQESRVLRPAGVTARLKTGSLLGYHVVLEQRTTDEKPPA